MSTQELIEEYVLLTLDIDQHMPGYIDAYFGPPEWKDRARATGKRPLPELTRRAEILADGVSADGSLEAQRKDFLSRHVRAMRTTLRLLSGEKMSLADETEQIYDLRPEWADEAVFEEAHRRLDELLPPGGSLLDRVRQRKQALEIPVEKARELLPMICDRLRQATLARFPLPTEESLEFQFVSDKPWNGYNWYLGGCRSRIDINTDLPIRAPRLVQLVAHEAYPGHHTELSIKDSRLLGHAAQLEHCVMLINSPSCVISEGIATRALSVILSEDEQRQWFVQEIFPRAGLDPALGEGEPQINALLFGLGRASDNAAFMLHERGAERGGRAALPGEI